MRGFFLIITALAIWSSWGLFVRWVDKPAVVIAFYNALFAMVFQGAALLMAGRRGKLHMGRDMGAVLLLGVCGLANFLLYIYALKATTIASAAFTHYTAPVFVAVLAPLILKDRMGGGTLFALALSFAGLVLIFGRGLESMGGPALWGALAGTGSGLAYAFVIIILRAISRRNHPLKLAFLPAALSFIVLAPFALMSGSAGLTLKQGLIFLTVGLFHSTLANVVYSYGIREVKAQDAGVLGYMEAVLAISLAFLFLGETPPALAVLGGALIVVSGLVVMRQAGRGVMGGADDNRC